MVVTTTHVYCFAAQLLQAIYNHYIKDEQVIDITVEDPSDEFMALRDFVDVRNCADLPSYQSSVIKNGFTQEMAKQAREQFKINKRQARKVYEILRLKVTNRSDPLEYKNYRLDVKRRLNKPFQSEKVKRFLEPNELAVTTASTGLEERHQKLSAMYEVTEELYRRTIEKLAAA
jgi:histone acetyltransferase 1